MTAYRERTIRGDAASDHIVQLFDLPESLATGVAAFLAAGLAQDGKLLMVARPHHVDAIVGQLAAAGYDTAALAADETITVLDARETLRKFIRGGMPDAALFDGVVGDLVRRLAASSPGRLNVYGEMVDILAEEGSFAAVDALEALWNELSQAVCFSVLCGYGASHFAAAKGSERLRAICGQHTRIERADDDMLGNWLLNASAPNPAA